MSRSRHATWSLVVTLVAMFLLVMAYALPFWVNYEYKPEQCTDGFTVRVSVGVWYVMACKDGSRGSCTVRGIRLQKHSNNTFAFQVPGCTTEDVAANVASGLGSYVYWWAVQLTSTFGLGLLLLATLVLLFTRCAGVVSKALNIAMCVLLALGGALTLSVAVLVAVCLAHTFIIPDLQIQPETFPWNALIAAIGGVLAIAGACLTVVTVCLWTETEVKARSDSMEMSEMCHSDGGIYIEPGSGSLPQGVVLYTGRANTPRIPVSEDRYENTTHQRANTDARNDFLSSNPNVYQRNERRPTEHFTSETKESARQYPEPKADYDVGNKYGRTHFSNSKKYKEEDSWTMDTMTTMPTFQGGYSQGRQNPSYSLDGDDYESRSENRQQRGLPRYIIGETGERYNDRSEAGHISDWNANMSTGYK
ncbi:uncharacterized protein LOC128218701 [Mya arenaria]|nr:uncharacterized protein LOC128218701 [Mya arenaria]